jgi:hypothetical protein
MSKVVPFPRSGRDRIEITIEPGDGGKPVASAVIVYPTGRRTLVGRASRSTVFAIAGRWIERGVDVSVIGGAA